MTNAKNATPESQRPRAYELNHYPWHLGKVPPTVKVGGEEKPHPAWRSAIFVVHGMGTQVITETAATLRSGFEDVIESLLAWERKEGIETPLAALGAIPPPLIAEGYWADYEDLKATFPEDWADLDGRKRNFFAALWRTRLLSPTRTFFWFLRQQARLLNPRVIWEVGLFAWFLYIPLQVVSLAALLITLLRWRKILSRVLADVRLYVAPEGITERAIVQRIDYRVGSEFLRMLGLDWEFRPLPLKKQRKLKKKPLNFERVIWVAHSLGTVISFNVLSDLFAKAEELSASGDAKQRRGVEKFQKALRRFVTIGSPLDKIAYLFGERTLRPWPSPDRQKLVSGGETIAGQGERSPREWWINFYHVLDPVSGPLTSPLICGQKPPLNLHIGFWALPGLAHVAYWRDSLTLRFVLSRVYGRTFLQDKEYKPQSALGIKVIAAIGYIVWAALIMTLAFAAVVLLPRYIIQMIS